MWQTVLSCRGTLGRELTMVVQKVVTRSSRLAWFSASLEGSVILVGSTSKSLSPILSSCRMSGLTTDWR